MGQLGFFDVNKRLLAISAKGDPLEMIDRVVPFESFRAEIEAVVLTPAEDKKSAAGRKPIDVIVMFRMLVLQSLYNLSDEQVEYQAGGCYRQGSAGRSWLLPLRYRSSVQSDHPAMFVEHRIRARREPEPCSSGGSRPPVLSIARDCGSHADECDCASRAP